MSGSTYIRCRKDGNENSILVELIAVLDDHVRSADQVEIMPLQKVHDDLLTEAITHSALVRLPVLFHIRRVAPQKIIQQTVVRHIGRTCNSSNVIHMGEARRQTTMDTEDLASDDRSDGEAVEGINKGLPDFDVATPFTFIIEPINAGDVGTLVVAT